MSSIVRKWGVGHQTQASEKADKRSVQSGWAGTPGSGFLPRYPEKAPLLHHQHHHSLCALLLTLPSRLLPACQRFSLRSQYLFLDIYTSSWISVTSEVSCRQQARLSYCNNPKKTFPSLNEIFSAFCSWWPEVHHVYCHSSGPDCFPLPYCQEGPRDVEGSATDWQVSFSLW